jgi:NAD(P)-dependent dehydrogenase (short-subunit alcohol dehydrogenase family)
MGLVDGKCGIVTGAASGLGRACAALFGSEGASVVVMDLAARQGEGEETVRLVEAAGAHAVFFPGDVTNEDDQAAVVEHCVREFGRLDFAHNNAGVDLQASIEETTVGQWEAALDVNLKGVWLGMKHQLAQMRRQGGGAIVNTSSLAGLKGSRNHGAYSASKHGIIGLTKVAALEAGDAGVRVNCVCPAAVRTPMLDELDEEVRSRITQPQAIQRLIEPCEVAEAVVWLASDRSSAVSGTSLILDLGTVAAQRL